MSQANSSPVGYDAPRFIEFLIKSLPQIEMVKLFRPLLSEPIQRDSTISVTDQDVIAQGLTIREKLNLPFWDSLLLYLSTHPAPSQRLLKRVTRHNPQD